MAGGLAGVERDVARSLALGILNVAQGHPKLLKLADGQAADQALELSTVIADSRRKRGAPATAIAAGMVNDYYPRARAWFP